MGRRGDHWKNGDKLIRRGLVKIGSGRRVGIIEVTRGELDRKIQETRRTGGADTREEGAVIRRTRRRCRRRGSGNMMARMRN